VDLLRGLAIFFVLMNHIYIRLRIAKMPFHLPDALVWNGQQGVQIFFAVSGFLITTTALRRWGAGIDIPAFYRLRFARIAPLLLLLLAILSTLDLTHAENFVINPKVATLPRALLAALTFHINVLEARHGYLPANWDILWSLSVEEVFYLVFPLVRRYTWLFIALLVTCIILGPISRTHGNEIWQEYSYLGGMDAIALGCLTALLVQKRQFSPRILVALGTPLILFTLCMYRSIGYSMTILAIGTCLIIAASAQTEWRAPRILSPLLSLGRRSYEVYLTHMFVVFALVWLFRFRLVPLLFLCTIIMSGLVGELVARVYSEPMNRYIRGVGKITPE